MSQCSLADLAGRGAEGGTHQAREMLGALAAGTTGDLSDG